MKRISKRTAGAVSAMMGAVFAIFAGAVSAQDIVSATEPHRADGLPVMQLGLSDLNGLEDPFIDAVRGFGLGWQAVEFRAYGSEMKAPDLWAGGYIDPETLLPKAVPDGFKYVRTPLFRTGARYDAAAFAGTWVVEFEGAGDALVHLGCAGKQKRVAPGRLEFTCADSDAVWTWVLFGGLDAGGLRNVHIFRKDEEALFRAGKTFRPQFIDYANDYDILRTLDLQGVNVTCVRSVDQLSKKTMASWGAPAGINQTGEKRGQYLGFPMGPPTELLFDIAVAADASLWTHIAGPIGAPPEIDELCIGGLRHNEAFQQKTQIAVARDNAAAILSSPEWDKYADEIVRSLIASGYPEARALYIETGNEIWNNANPFWWYRDYFAGLGDWAKAQEPADGESSVFGAGFMEAHFAVKLDEALKRAGRKQALMFVLGSQMAGPARSRSVIAGFKHYFAVMGGDPAPYLARAGLSTASYYGSGIESLFPGANADEKTKAWLGAIAADPEGTAKKLTDWYLTSGKPWSVPTLIAYRKQHARIAADAGIRFIGDYEGESHDWAFAPLRDNTAFRDWYFNVWLDGPEGERLTRGWVEQRYADDPDAIISNYKGACVRQVQFPWCDGTFSEDTGRRRALREFLRQ